jgi:hyperosmotically inducible periplasmic protein
MKLKARLCRSSVLLGCLAICMMPYASSAQDQSPQSTTAPDNSANNKMHRKTADQQMGDTPDRATTQKIRKAIIADKSLSMYGHNVKIITRNGAVTLKGPVHSQEEKDTIASKAAEVVGQDKVMNQLTVKQ